jgi:hypothetical protein
MKNAPNMKRSTTVVARLFFSIQALKESRMFEALCGTAA